MGKSRSLIDGINAELAEDPELADLVSQEDLNVEIAQQVHDLRKGSGLTQQELARKIRTTQSVISRVEDADYDGRSLSLLRRIAEALGKKLCVKFCSEEEKRFLLSSSTNTEAKIVVLPRQVDRPVPAFVYGSFYLNQSLVGTQQRTATPATGDLITVGSRKLWE